MKLTLIFLAGLIVGMLSSGHIGAANQESGWQQYQIREALSLLAAIEKNTDK